MMAEYNESICRGCFHSYVCEQFNEHKDDDNKKCHFYNDHFVPAADVVEVRHGHWIEKIVKPEWLDDDVEIYYVCSVCECNDFGKSPYCPFCGAKMDGKEEK